MNKLSYKSRIVMYCFSGIEDHFNNIRTSFNFSINIFLQIIFLSFSQSKKLLKQYLKIYFKKIFYQRSYNNNELAFLNFKNKC